MFIDLSTIVYFVLVLLVLGLLIPFGRVLASIILVGVGALFVAFALLLIADMVTGGSALQQLSDALAPIVAGGFTAFLAWLRRKQLTTSST